MKKIKKVRKTKENKRFWMIYRLDRIIELLEKINNKIPNSYFSYQNKCSGENMAKASTGGTFRYTGKVEK